MNKVIEADFLPREPGRDFSWPDSTPTSRVNEKRRILIVDNDRNATHLVRILLEKTGQYLVLEEKNSITAHPRARLFCQAKQNSRTEQHHRRRFARAGKSVPLNRRLASVLGILKELNRFRYLSLAELPTFWLLHLSKERPGSNSYVAP